jgi:hypothetical protein
MVQHAGGVNLAPICNRSTRGWFRQAFQADGMSVMKNRWIEIRFGNRRCFAQIKDCGSYHTDDANYVFNNARPLPHENNQAALDVSPAVQRFLGLASLAVCSWRFVESREVPPGPWLMHADNGVLALKK